jgi:hypothetical protein
LKQLSYCMDIADRLQQLLGVLKLNPNQFAKELGYERPEKIYGILNKKFKPSFDTLMDIVTHYPQVNANWLLRGESSMFTADEKSNSEATSLEAQKIKWLELQLAEKDKQLTDKERMMAILEKQVALLEKIVENKR